MAVGAENLEWKPFGKRSQGRPPTMIWLRLRIPGECRPLPTAATGDLWERPSSGSRRPTADMMMELFWRTHIHNIYAY